MDNTMMITSVSNAGVVVSGGGKGLLVDGLYDCTGLPFSPPPPVLLEAMLAGRPVLGPITHLFATHRHPDHFSAQLVAAFARANPLAGALLPPGSAGCEAAAALRQGGAAVQVISLAIGECQRFDLGGDFVVTAFNTGHMGRQYADVDNLCLLVEMAGRRVLITGDADFHPALFETALGGGGVDAALVNPLFYHNRRGVDIVNRIIRPRRLVLYHIPAAADDAMALRRTVARLIERHREEGYPIHAFTGAMQVVAI